MPYFLSFIMHVVYMSLTFPSSVVWDEEIRNGLIELHFFPFVIHLFLIVVK